MATYNQSEINLPKWTQQLLDELRTENINLRSQATAAIGAHVIRLERDWFVMPGPKTSEPAIRVWLLTEDGPQQIGTLKQGHSLMFQRETENPPEA